MRANTALPGKRMNGSNSIPVGTSTRRSSSRPTSSTSCAGTGPAVLDARARRPRHEHRSVPAGRGPLPADARRHRRPGRTPARRSPSSPRARCSAGTSRCWPEAATSVPVGLGVSMAIWDDDLHDALEPGVPTPRARLDLVRALTDAGLPCGVFLAPVLPGLTDGTEHLDAALGAIAAAGATGVTVIPLHLRPGAREWFMAWLARAHPELVPRYEQLYARRAYVPGRVPHLAVAAGRAAAGEARAGPAEGRRRPAGRCGDRDRGPRRRGGRLPRRQPALRRPARCDEPPGRALAAGSGGAARAPLRPRSLESLVSAPTVRSRRCRSWRAQRPRHGRSAASS